MKKYSFLEPIQIGNVTLRNRVILGAMAKYLSTEDGYITDEYCAHYAGIARGGAALIIPGIMAVDSKWPYVSKNQPFLDDDKYIPGMKKVVDAVHAEGAKFAFQLWHSGLAGTNKSVNDFSLEEIKKIQDQYVSAARRCKQAGADGIEFHIAHTYLPSQFLSPYFNKRKDQYGSDTIENAMRFSIECINRIRDELCNDDFFIISKINGHDFVEGGTTPEWAAAAAVLLEKAGVAMITVNGGGALTKINCMSDDGRQKEGWKIPFAKIVKDAVSIPVAGTGSLRHPEYVDEILKNGDCDLVSIARGLMAEPEWVNKAASGEEEKMRCCISCMFCFNIVERGTSGCSVNPFAKRDLEKPELLQNGNGRTIAVIGAGPSGLEAAVTLAERGFKPVVFEKKERIGGLVALAAVPPGKQKLGWMMDYYQKQIDRLDISLKLGAEASVEGIKEINPYAVVVAAGSVEFVPNIQGINGSNVISARGVLEKDIQVKDKRVVVLGGGLTGLETARALREKGNEVTVLEMMPMNPAPNMETKLALADIAEDGIKISYQHKVSAIREGFVEATDLHHDSVAVFDADMVVLSMGIQSNTRLLDELKRTFERVVPVGDCDVCGKISTAVQSGSAAGYSIN